MKETLDFRPLSKFFYGIKKNANLKKGLVNCLDESCGLQHICVDSNRRKKKKKIWE